jgi:hypothetical protein
MHFYEAPGNPKLDGTLLCLFHYDTCEPAKAENVVELRLMWDLPGRPTETLEFHPVTRRLLRQSV